MYLKDSTEIYFLKISFIRMVFCFLALGSLLTNFEFSGWQTMSAAELVVHFALLWTAIALGTLAAVGYRSNITVLAFAWAMVASNMFVFVFVEAKYLMHAQIFFAFALMVLNYDDCGRYFSLTNDNVTNKPLTSERGKHLFMAYLIGIYIMSVIGKWSPGYLTGVALESQIITYTLGSLPLPIEFDPWVYVTMSMIGMVVEILIPIGLIWRKTRFVTVIFAYVFHMFLLFFLHPKWFSFGMPLGLLVFIDDARFARWIGIRQN